MRCSSCVHPAQSSLIPSFCKPPLLHQCWCVLAPASTEDGFFIRLVVEHRVAGLCSWICAREINFISKTMRRGYKCCFSSFKQWLRCLRQAECLRITLSWRWRDKPACWGEHQSWLYQPCCCWATGVKSSLRNTYSDSNCSYYGQHEMSLVHSWEHPCHSREAGGDSCPSDQKMLFISLECGKTTWRPTLYKWYFFIWVSKFSCWFLCCETFTVASYRVLQTVWIRSQVLQNEEFNLCPEGRTSHWLLSGVVNSSSVTIKQLENICPLRVTWAVLQGKHKAGGEAWSSSRVKMSFKLNVGIRKGNLLSENVIKVYLCYGFWKHFRSQRNLFWFIKIDWL